MAGEPSAGRSARSGSAAGRGYRYQDGVAGYLAVLAVTDELSVEQIYCEGLEDVNFHAGGSAVRAQVKSRRPDLPPNSWGHVASDVSALLRRHREEMLDDPDIRVVLVAESFPSDLFQTGWVRTLEEGDDTYRRLVEAFAGIEKSPEPGLLLRVSLVRVPSPEAQAVQSLTERFGLLPVASQLVFLRLRQALADSADANYDGVALSYTRTDLERMRAAALEAVNVDSLETALSQGFVEPLDLMTPLEEKAFYLGVDVQPGHLVAGYLIARPNETTEIIEGLQDRRAVLVAGPSGAGKSALTWLAAAETALEVTWYRAKRLTAEAVEPIARLTRALGEGNAGSRVGLIVDDVGRTPGPWDELTAFAASRPGLLLLGSIREEDLPLLTGQQHLVVERPHLDELLAEAIYNRLRGQGDTTWSGWREPYEASNGLLMEYVHILTAGSRLENTISRQVQARLSDEKRHDELAALRLVAMADTYGCEVPIDALRRFLDLTDDQLGKALQRLYEEHLVRETGTGSVGGLHHLRSNAIVRAAHALGSPTPAETARRLLDVLGGIDLTVFIAAVLEPSQDSGDDILRAIGMASTPGASILEADVVQRALQERLENSPRIPVVTAVLQGLRLAGFRRTARDWWRILDDAGTAIPLRQVLTNFALIDSDLSGGSFPAPFVTLVRRLREYPVTDLRDGMEEAVAKALAAAPINIPASEIESLLLAAAQWSGCDEAVRTAVVRSCCDLADSPLTVVIDILKAASTHSDATAAAVAECLGGEAELLSRYAAEQAWIYDVGCDLGNEAEPIVAAKWLFIDTSFAHGDPGTLGSRDANNVHDAVVECCRDLLALQPSAAIAKVVAVDATGEAAGFGDHVIADKSIPRRNLPTTGAIVWNRIRLVTADTLAWATTTTTDRLIAEADLLRRLATAMKTFGDHWVVGSFTQSPVPDAARQALSALTRVGEEGATLPSPSSPVSVGVVLRTLSDPRMMPELPGSNATAEIVTSIVDNLVPRLVANDSSDGTVGGYIGNSILPVLEQLRDDKQWELVETNTAVSAGELLAVLQDIHDFVEGTKGRPEKRVRRFRNEVTGRPAALSLAAQRLRDSARSEADRLAKRVRDRLQPAVGAGEQIDVAVRPCRERYGPIWPPYDYCALIHSEDPLVLAKVEDKLRASKGFLPMVASLSAAPVIRDRVIAPLAVNVFVGVVLPSPNSGVEWATSEELQTLESPSYEAAASVLGALVTTSAILMLSDRRGNRPIEEEVYRRAEAKYSEGILVLHQAASIAAGEPTVLDLAAISGMTPAAQATVPGQALSFILGWAGQVADEESAISSPGVGTEPAGSLAAAVARMVRGQEPAMLGAMVVVNVLLLLHDLDPALATEFMNSL